MTYYSIFLYSNSNSADRKDAWLKPWKVTLAAGLPACRPAHTCTVQTSVVLLHPPSCS